MEEVTEKKATKVKINEWSVGPGFVRVTYRMPRFISTVVIPIKEQPLTEGDVKKAIREHINEQAVWLERASITETLLGIEIEV